MLTPGGYIRKRRLAAGLSVADVAEKIGTVPPIAEHARADWITMIEADTMPARFDTLVVLRNVFPFDLDILAHLVAITMGAQFDAPRLCDACGCSEFDPCDDAGGGCWWVGPHLCSRCGPPPPAQAAIGLAA